MGVAEAHSITTIANPVISNPLQSSPRSFNLLRTAIKRLQCPHEALSFEAQAALAAVSVAQIGASKGQTEGGAASEAGEAAVTLTQGHRQRFMVSTVCSRYTS